MGFVDLVVVFVLLKVDVFVGSLFCLSCWWIKFVNVFKFKVFFDICMKGEVRSDFVVGIYVFNKLIEVFFKVDIFNVGNGVLSCLIYVKVFI